MTSESARQPGRAIIAILVLCAAVNPLAINIFVPSMPSMQAEFGTSYATIQLGLSLYLALTAVVTLLAGPASDMLGRRPVIIAGFLLFLAGTVIALLARDVTVFLIGRALQTGSAAGMTLSRAIVRDLYDRDRAASMIGYVTMGLSVAPMLGPALGGLLDEHFGWRASFLLLGVLGLVATLTGYALLPETHRRAGRAPGDQMAAYRALFLSPAFWLLSATSSLAAGVFFAFLGGAPAIASNWLAMTPASYGLWFAICAFGYMAGNFIAGRYSMAYGLDRMIVAGAVLAMLGGVLPFLLFQAGFRAPIALFGPAFLIGLGNGVTLPNAIAAAVSILPEAAGAASGLLGSLQVATGAAASVVSGIATGNGLQVIAFSLCLAAIALVALAMAVPAARMARRESQ